MSLIHRKPRPLTRAPNSFRDDRLFIIACDDTYAPKQYFDMYQLPRVKVHVVETIDGTSAAQHVLNRLLEFACEPDDERWMILDTDHCIQGSHLPGYIAAIREARNSGVNVAISRPCFELWLLLHHVHQTEVTGLPDATSVEQKLRHILGSYNKTRLMPEHFPLTAVAAAVNRAEKLDSSVSGGAIPTGNTTRLHLIWRSIVSKAGPSQVPDELRSLLSF